MTRFFCSTLHGIILCLFISGSVGRCADFWVSGTDASVVTSNDCGQISATHGLPVVVRSFQQAGSPGVKAMITDKVYSGDEVHVPDGSRLEIVSGSNVAMVFGEGSRVRFSGLRWLGASGKSGASRLDLELVAGEMRVQVRRNMTRPESVLVSAGEAQFLIKEGDVCLTNSSSWQGAVLAGEGMGRLRRGATIGAPFAIPEGTTVGEGGAGELAADSRSRFTALLPFSFELTRTALPPLPSLSYELEAP